MHSSSLQIDIEPNGLLAPQDQYIIVNRSKHRVVAELRVFKLDGGDHWIYLIPSLNMTGYGDTIEQAREMLKNILEDYFLSLLAAKKDDMEIELGKYGWKKGLFNKQFRNNSYVDSNGILKDFDMPSETKIMEEKMQVA